MKYLKIIVTSALALFLLSFEAYAEELVLRAPALSKDGSYILRLESESLPEKMKVGQLELYRNFDGGKYKLVARLPLFNSISQLMSQNGVYGYKLRWVSKSRASRFSQPVFVSVDSRNPIYDFNKSRRNDLIGNELALGAR